MNAYAIAETTGRHTDLNISASNRGVLQVRKSPVGINSDVYNRSVDEQRICTHLLAESELEALSRHIRIRAGRSALLA